jgi:hypothetical protein
MTTVRGMTDGFPGGQRRSYIATMTFNTVFYTYSNNQLVPLPSMYEGYCPAGHILRENGKKLFPDTNPGVTQYYVGVYDAVSFFNGYIDPNDAHFAVYNTDKPVYVPDNYDFGNSMPDLGPSVYTQGNIIAQLSPEGNNIVAIINSTINEYTAYSQLYFNDPDLPAVEVGNNPYNSYAGAYINNVSSALIQAYSEFPYIVAEGGDTANITAIGFHNAYVTARQTNNEHTFTQLHTDDYDGHIVIAGEFYPSLLISSPQAVIRADFDFGGSNNTEAPQLNLSNADYYAGIYFNPYLSNSPGFIEAGSNASFAGIDGQRGDLYATGMLSLENSVGAMQLGGGTATTGSNTVFTYDPYIFLTYQTTNSGTPGTLTYSVNTGAGTLTIDSGSGSDSNYVNWLAVYNNF